MSETMTTPGAPPVRASDAERDQAAEILRAGYAEGRLTSAELGERLTAAYAAKTRADLHALTSDLPGAVPAATPDRPATAALPPADPESGTGPRLNVCLLACLLCACRRPGSPTGSWPSTANASEMVTAWLARSWRRGQ